MIENQLLSRMISSQMIEDYSKIQMFAQCADLHFIGNNLKIIKSKAKRLLVSGGTGTGKTVAILNKWHRCAIKYPGCRLGIFREERSAMSETVLKTFENDVLGGRDHPLVEGKERKYRLKYTYPNDSEIVVGGLDRSSKVMSSDFDAIYVNEARETTPSKLYDLDTRLREGILPYAQIICDTNPDMDENHWLIEMRDNGFFDQYIHSTHEDNPKFYDPSTKTWTKKGQEYIDRLESLPPFQRARYRYGLWVAPSGLVFEYFGDRNVSDEYDYDPRYPLMFFCDDGFSGEINDNGFYFKGGKKSNPRVFLFAQKQGDKIVVFDEDYRVQTLKPDHLKIIKEKCESVYKMPALAVVDKSASELRSYIANYFGINDVISSDADVNLTLDNLIEFIGSEDIEPILYINPRCRYLIHEIKKARYDEKTHKRNDYDDHGLDAVRYGCFKFRYLNYRR